MESHAVQLALALRPERTLIRRGGSFRHIDVQLSVAPAPGNTVVGRAPLRLALVLDRSGSMQGAKLHTAKRAVMAVLERLEERDEAALVVFNDRVQVVQPMAPVTGALRTAVQAALAEIEARSNTALHEGWLTGCQAIIDEYDPTNAHHLARCFLLTDGLANVGVTDPEQIASEAAGIRAHTGIGTSTFGVGEDYNELLLGPLAVAGGGQFHHLRTADEITTTFLGELGDLLAVAARRVRLELEVDAGLMVDLTSAYWAQPVSQDTSHWIIDIGDLLSGEERHVVVRLGFPAQAAQEGHSVRARLLWLADDCEQSGDWQEVRFLYSDQQACDAEVRDPSVMHWVGLHQADRAHREAIRRSQSGDLSGAREQLREVSGHISRYAGEDEELHTTMTDLRQLEEQLSDASLPSSTSKELWYQQQTRSRGQKDYRQSDSQ